MNGRVLVWKPFGQFRVKTSRTALAGGRPVAVRGARIAALGLLHRASTMEFGTMETIGTNGIVVAGVQQRGSVARHWLESALLLLAVDHMLAPQQIARFFNPLDSTMPNNTAHQLHSTALTAPPARQQGRRSRVGETFSAHTN